MSSDVYPLCTNYGLCGTCFAVKKSVCTCSAKSCRIGLSLSLHAFFIAISK